MKFLWKIHILTAILYLFWGTTLFTWDLPQADSSVVSWVFKNFMVVYFILIAKTYTRQLSKARTWNFEWVKVKSSIEGDNLLYHAFQFFLCLSLYAMNMYTGLDHRFVTFMAFFSVVCSELLFQW